MWLLGGTQSSLEHRTVYNSQWPERPNPSLPPFFVKRVPTAEGGRGRGSLDLAFGGA